MFASTRGDKCAGHLDICGTDQHLSDLGGGTEGGARLDSRLNPVVSAALSPRPLKGRGRQFALRVVEAQSLSVDSLRGWRRLCSVHRIRAAHAGCLMRVTSTPAAAKHQTRYGHDPVSCSEHPRFRCR